MSAKARPEREYRSAQREGNPARATGRPEREHRSAQRDGDPMTDGDPITIKRWLLTHEGYRFGA